MDAYAGPPVTVIEIEIEIEIAATRA